MNLMSKSDMASRWGVSRQVVNNWEARHNDFPPIYTKVDNGRMPLYLLGEVQKYEKKRGLKKMTKIEELYNLIEEEGKELDVRYSLEDDGGRDIIKIKDEDAETTDDMFVFEGYGVYEAFDFLKDIGGLK